MWRSVLLALALSACATPAQANNLDVFRLLEGCWIGSFAGSDLRDRRCIAPMQDAQQWRDVHEVIGAGYGGETIFAWDAEHQRIDVGYYANDGSLMRGHGMVVRGGISFPEARYVNARGEVQLLRSRWLIPIENDRFEVITEVQEGDAWRELMRIAYVRAPA